MTARKLGKRFNRTQNGKSGDDQRLFAEPTFDAALETLGLGTMMFSVDCPLAIADAVKLLDRIDLGSPDFGRVRYGNALGLVRPDEVVAARLVEVR